MVRVTKIEDGVTESGISFQTVTFAPAGAKSLLRAKRTIWGETLKRV